MSRWMIERAWAALRASAVSLMIRRASSTGSLPAPPDPPGDRLPVHVAHDEVDQSLALADRVDGHDVGVGQLGGRLGLAGEPLPDVLLEGQLRRQHLDRHPALEALVPGAVDHPHAAAADLPLDGVGVAQGLAEPRRQRLIGGVGHGRGRRGCRRERGGAAEGLEPPNMAPNLYPRAASGN